MSVQTLSIPSETMVSSIKNYFQQEVGSAEKSDEQSFDGACPSFPISVFPEKIQRIVQALHREEGLNLDYLCASMFTVLAAAMGNQWTCHFKSTWQDPPIIFLVLIGPPSCGKTPPLKLAVRPLHLFDAELERAYRNERERYERAMVLSREEREANGFDADPVRPVCRSVLTINSTIEALYSVLDQSRRGVLTYVDELDSLLSNMSRYNRGSDDTYWLQLFNGDGIKLNRKSSEGPMTILHPYVSLIGGTQPGLLPELLGGKRMTSGFSSRLLKVFPDITEMPEWTMQQVSPCILDDWNSIVRSILEIPSVFDENGDVIPRVVRFNEKAKNTLCHWRNGKHRREWKETDEDYLRGFYGKLETYAVRFCLIIQVIRSFCDNRCSSSVIDEDSVKSAISLAEYFRSMEKKVFLYISDRKDEGKDMVMFGKLPDEFRTSDAHALGNTLGMSESTVKRFLKRCCASVILINPKHGLYQKVMRKEEKEHVTQ